MNIRTVTYAALVLAALGLTPMAGQAQMDPNALKWKGDIYMKFLDGNRAQSWSMSNNFDTTPGESGGDQGQATELDLTLTGQVSKQVEFYARIQSRLHRGFWANYDGFAVPGHPNQSTVGSCTEADPRCNWYIKLRGARVILTPGYDWIDSASIGSNDWGMFDAWTHGQTRYIDRDNLNGFLFQGSALGKKLRWDFARVSLPSYEGAGFTTGDLFANDADYVGQVKYTPSAAWNATLIGMFAKDSEADPTDQNNLNGVRQITRWDNGVVGLKGQYSGFSFMDLKGAYYYSKYKIADDVCSADNLLTVCTYSPFPKKDTSDDAFYLNLDFNRLFVDGLSLAVQFFNIGSDYVAAPAARREADVLLTEGQEATWQWMMPDYNFGNRKNASSNAGLGYGGWDGQVQQVVSGLADNDVTDFDEAVAFNVVGWKGVTVVPKYQFGDWQFSGEYSYIDFNTNWQACGVQDKEHCIYPMNESTHAWGYGGDTRSPYAAYQDRLMQIFALKAKYTLDVGSGINLMARYKYISDRDNRVTKSSMLTDAYDGYPLAAGAINPHWVPNIGLGGCVSCDDRKADYDTYGVSAGYQLTSDLYATVLYELNKVELIDGTVDVAPVGVGTQLGNAGGWIEYLTGKTTKNRVGMNFSYFLSGVEIGGTVDYFWGNYDPYFYTNSGTKRVKLIPDAGATTVATPMGDIPIGSQSLSQYRMKVYLKVVF